MKKNLIKRFAIGVGGLCISIVSTYFASDSIGRPHIDADQEYSTSLHGRLEIYGPPTFIDATSKSLDLLKRKDQEVYEVVQQYLSKLEYVDQGSGVYVWENPPRAVVGRKIAEQRIPNYAASIVHEACHSALYKGHLKNNPADLEGALTISSGRKAAIRCIEKQQKSRMRLGGFLPFKWFDAAILEIGKHYAYEEIPYEKRYW